MKTTFKILFLVVIGAGIIYQSYVFLKPKTAVKTYIPDLPVKLLDNSNSTLAEMGHNQNTIVFIVRSNCEFCKQEVAGVRNNIDRLQNTEIIFLSFESLGVINEFKKHYFPEERPNITFAQTLQSELTPLLEYDLVFPYMLWYNTKGIQKAQHRGLFPIERLIDVINVN